MPQNAWSLLVFTLFAQMSVGAFCVSELINRSYTKKFGFENLNPLRYFSRLFVFAAIILAGISSIFHLKNWTNAYHAINNLKTSWVSKEMLFFFLFASCVALLVFMSWRKVKAYLAQRIIGIFGALTGIILIYAMAKIYMLPTILSLNNWTTHGLFFTTAILLGTLAIVVLYSTSLKSTKSISHMDGVRERWRKKTFPFLLKTMLFFIVIGILITGFFACRLFMLAEAYGLETSVLNPDSQLLLFFRIILYVPGWALLFLGLKKTRQRDEVQEKTHRLVLGASILITLAEIVGRYLFYVSFYRIGV